MADYSTARRNMVDCQVRTSDVTDLQVIQAMLALPRERFVPEDRRGLAYLDLDLNVSPPDAPKRSLIKPAVVARMVQAASIRASDRVLVVGCATGYTAALAGALSRHVTATEFVPALVTGARALLAELAPGVSVAQAESATTGHEAGAPYDVILLDGATEVTPTALYRQLKEGGRLVGIFATNRPQRAMVVVRSRDDFGTRPLFDATAPILPGLERLPAFVF